MVNSFSLEDSKSSTEEDKVLALVTSSGSPPNTTVSFTTLTLANTSGSTQSANFISPMFGHPFKKGDIPSGAYPQFQATDGTNMPYTHWCDRSWGSDSSKKFSGFLLRSPKSIAGSGSLTVNVLNGGSAPAASNRTLTEVSNALIQVNATGSPGGNLSGTWTNPLSQAITDNIEICVLGDGPAGKVWRILGHFYQGGFASGNRHGQLMCYHYIAALQDSSGNLAGFRYLPRVCQPWYNLDSPAKNWRAFSTLNFQYGAGPTTVNFAFPYSSNVTTWNGDVTNYWLFTMTGNNYATGSSDVNWVAGYFTTTGTLPTGLSLNTIYFASVAGAGSNTITLNAGSFSGSGLSTVSSAGSGTHTFNPVPICLHFGSQFGMTSSGEWNYIQGAGSIAADPTVLVQFNQTYWRSTKCLPPYDLTITTPTANSWGGTYNIDTCNVGPLTTYVGATGERDDIGVLPSWHARHFYNQTANDRKTMLAIGFAGAHFGNLLRDNSTLGPTNMSNNSYTGLPASSTGLRWSAGSADVSGFTAPPSNNGCLGFLDNGYDHKPSCAYYPYLVTGRPEFLDILMEEALGAQAHNVSDQGASGRNPTSPLTKYGLTTAADTQTRAIGWATRDMGYCWGIYPDTSPDGKQIKQYWTDIGNDSAAWLNTWVSSGLNSYAATNKLWQVPPGIRGSWQLGYVRYGVCVLAGLCESADAITWLQGDAHWGEYVRTTWSGWQNFEYYEITTVSDAGVTPISSDVQYGGLGNGATSGVTWTAGSPGAFSWNTTGGGFTPSNGDKIIWNGSWFGTHPVPGNLTAYVSYYAVNTSGVTFNVAASPGGAALAISDSFSGGDGTGNDEEGIFMTAANPSSSGCYAAVSSTQDYVCNVRGGWMYATACGATGYSNLLTDIATRFTADGGPYSFSNAPHSFVADPKNAMVTSF